jgi:histidinol phosphatase-like PHP family hydrolase
VTSPFVPVDLHAHTTMSDGALAPADLVAVVRGRGVRPSVADHLSRDVTSAVKTVVGVRSYLDELESHPGLLRGGEFCWHDSLWRELPDDVVRRFTHWVGSIHAIYLTPERERYVHMFQRRLPDELTPDVYMDAHVAELERFAAEMPVDVLAHPTLLPIPYRSLPLEELWTEAREERAVAALHRAGIAFEISNRYRPHERFVRRAADHGVRISLGSDGHTPEQVGDVAWPLALARSLGVADDELYDPERHGSRTR